MKKFMLIAMTLVLTTCLMTACGRRNVNETSIPTTTGGQATVPATTGRHNETTNGGGVVEDIIEDVTGAMTDNTAPRNSGSSRHNANPAR